MSWADHLDRRRRAFLQSTAAPAKNDAAGVDRQHAGTIEGSRIEENRAAKAVHEGHLGHFIDRCLNICGVILAAGRFDGFLHRHIRQRHPAAHVTREREIQHPIAGRGRLVGEFPIRAGMHPIALGGARARRQHEGEK